MIIDLILDRYHGTPYDPKEFYDRVMEYEDGSYYSISRALDGGEEEDIKRELCAYIDGAFPPYNPKIKDFINAVSWLDDDAGKDYSKEIDIMQESKKHFECSMQKRVESFKKNESGERDYYANLNDFVNNHTSKDALLDIVVSMCAKGEKEAKKLGLSNLRGPEYTRSLHRVVDGILSDNAFSEYIKTALYNIISGHIRNFYKPTDV